MTRPLTRPAARAVADVAGGTILATVDIAAPPERVFRALTSADEVLRWWGSDETYRTTVWESDVRAGGAWRAEGNSADGRRPFAVRGRYLIVDAPHLLVHTWEPDWDGGQTTTVTIRLTATPGGTRVVLRHDGFEGRPESRQRHGDGWQMVLGWLAAHAAPPGEPRYFLCRLIGPRPTFPADITPEEGALMHAHAAYWREKLEEGTAIVFGPVLDPKGVFPPGRHRPHGEGRPRGGRRRAARARPRGAAHRRWIDHAHDRQHPRADHLMIAERAAELLSARS